MKSILATIVTVLVSAAVVIVSTSSTSRAIDTDRDGIPDSVDNCPSYYNVRIVTQGDTIQPDADDDGIGNACDECTDQDGDGFGDPGFPTNTCPDDNCPGFYNPDQLDSDGDGIGDLCEGLECGDINGDGDAGDLADYIAFANYLLFGRYPPVSLHIANTGGCDGVNIHDLAHTFGSLTTLYLDCDGSDICPAGSGGSISLEHVDGAIGDDTLLTGQSLSFHLRVHGDDSLVFCGITNGFRVYSTTGAEWSSTSVREVALVMGDVPAMTIGCIGMTGSASDTIALGYFELAGGLPVQYNEVSHVIEIGPIPHEYAGGEICLDSCWFPPSNPWVWGSDNPRIVPSWDGPHCFTVVRCCDPRGDIDHSGIGPDIADLVYLVSYMFQNGPAPVCPEKADINGDSIGPDIADLVYLVTFMFQNGPPPAPCE